MEPDFSALRKGVRVAFGLLALLLVVLFISSFVGWVIKAVIWGALLGLVLYFIVRLRDSRE